MSRLRPQPVPCTPALEPALRFPRDIRAIRFRVGSDDFALLSCDLPRTETAMDCARGLTPSERSVVELVVGGHSNTEIARARAVSVQTVANQLAAVFRKLNVGSRRELVALTLREPKARP